jgi:hypothetical protein
MIPDCILSNIVFAYDRKIVDDFENEKAKEIIRLTFPSDQLDVGVTELSTFKSVYSIGGTPIQIVAQDKSLIVSENKINKSNDTGVELATLAFTLNKMLAEKDARVIAYGLNYSFAFNEKDTGAVEEAIRTKYLNPDAIATEDAAIKFYLPSYQYESGGVKYFLRYEAELNDENNLVRILIGANVHHKESFSGTAADLHGNYDEAYKILRDVVKAEVKKER